MHEEVQKMGFDESNSNNPFGTDNPNGMPQGNYVNVNGVPQSTGGYVNQNDIPQGGYVNVNGVPQPTGGYGNPGGTVAPAGYGAPAAGGSATVATSSNSLTTAFSAIVPSAGWSTTCSSCSSYSCTAKSRRLSISNSEP